MFYWSNVSSSLSSCLHNSHWSSYERRASAREKKWGRNIVFSAWPNANNVINVVADKHKISLWMNMSCKRKAQIFRFATCLFFASFNNFSLLLSVFLTVYVDAFTTEYKNHSNKQQMTLNRWRAKEQDRIEYFDRRRTRTKATSKMKKIVPKFMHFP